MPGGGLWSEYAARMSRAGHGEKGAVIAEIEAVTGLARPTIYKMLREAGYVTGRKRRSDAGSIKCGLTEQDLARIAGVQHLSKRKNKRVIMPTEVAVEVLTRAGELTASASLHTIRRHLRTHGLSRAQMEAAWTTDDHKTPTFYTQLKSKYPNHLHQFDITPCIQYFFEGRGLKQRDLNLQLYGKKMPEYRKVKKHLLRYVLVDHCTGAFFIRYYYASGERAADVIDFWWRAWRGQADQLDRYPFRGAPEILYLDKGAANLSGYVQTLLANLDVEMIAHKPGNPRAKGAVEGLMIFWEGRFESRLALTPAPDLDTLNAWALDACIYLNGTKEHRRHGHTRSALWASRIRTDRLRIPPDWEVFQALAHSEPVERVIGKDKLVKYKGRAYLVLDPVNVRDRVLVSHDPYNYPAINCRLISADGQLTPIKTVLLETDEAGFYVEHGAMVGEGYHRLPDSPTHTKLRELAGEDYSAAAAAAFGGWADELGNTRFVVRPGQEMELDEATDEPVTMTRLEALDHIRRALDKERLTPIEAQLIAARLGDEPWSRDAVEALAREMRAVEESEELRNLSMGVG